MMTSPDRHVEFIYIHCWSVGWLVGASVPKLSLLVSTACVCDSRVFCIQMCGECCIVKQPGSVITMTVVLQNVIELGNNCNKNNLNYFQGVQWMKLICDLSHRYAI